MKENIYLLYTFFNGNKQINDSILFFSQYFLDENKNIIY